MKSLQIIFGLMLAASAATAQQYTISTVAGIGTVQGYIGDGGPATGAQLDFPLRVAVDSKGNFFIADYLTHVVREVAASTGIITTIAGTGTFGFQGDNGPGIQGFITDVHGVATDSKGNVYIADTHNARVRMIVPGGNITTIAGNGTVGYSGDSAAATSAQLTAPSGVAVDAAGNVYIADYGNSTVRKVDSKGTITTLAGTGSWGYSGDGGPANKAALAAPYALAVDSVGNLYISDLGNTDIREVTTDGNIRTVVSTFGPESIAVDSKGSIYYPDFQTATVRKILSNGTQFVIAGTGRAGFSGDGGPATSAQLKNPYGVALDSAGNVYVADSGNQVIRVLSPIAATLSVVNAASQFGSTIAPGEIVTIYGTGLGPATPVVAQPGTNGSFGAQLGGTTVSFGGKNGPVIYTSATQVSVIVPYSAPIGNPVDVTVTYQGQAQTQSAVLVASSAPGVFTLNSTGGGPGAVVNQNGTINGPTTPAPLGSIVSVYATGEGQTTPTGVDGKPAAVPLPKPVLPVFATISGQQTTVTYAGGAPGLVAGLMQVNVQIPSNLVQNATGAVAVPLLIQVGDIVSQSNVTVYVTR